MKKKVIVSLIIATLLVTTVTIPKVRTFAESTLSVFRVNNAKTIKITINDIEDAMNYFKNLQDNHDEIATENREQVMENHKNDYKVLTSVSEFTAFDFTLPKELQSENPEIYATDSKSDSVVLDTNKINENLTKIGITNMVDNSYNGTKITINTSPSIMAKYSDVSLFATQGANIDGPSNVLEGLKSNILNMPFISDNLRSQLSPIDVKTHDIYLPVIMGLGHEVDLGGTTGYIYATNDLKQVLSSLPQDMTNINNELQNNENKTALIWTKNGILYGLIGDKSDSELANIARSIN